MMWESKSKVSCSICFWAVQVSCHPWFAFSCHSKIIYIMVDLLTAFWDVFDGNTNLSLQTVRALILRILCLKETSKKGSICKEKSGMAPMTLSSKSKNIPFKPIRNLSKNLELTIWSGGVYCFFQTGEPFNFPSLSHHPVTPNSTDS